MLKVKFIENVNVESEIELHDIEDEAERKWTENILKDGFWELVVIDNVKQIICINDSGVNKDERSCPSDAKDEDLRCRLVTNNGKVTLRELTELIYRIKGSKFDFWYELYQGFVTHLDEKGTLFIQVHFDHGS